MSTIHGHDFGRPHWGALALRWLAAGLAIVAMHAAVVYGALFWRTAEPAAAPAGALMIELAPLPVSAPSQMDDVAPGPEMVQSPEPSPAAADTPEDPAPPEPLHQDIAENVPELVPSPAPAEVVLPKPQPPPEVKPRDPPRPVEQPKPVEKLKRQAKPARRNPAPMTSAAPRSDAPVGRTTAAPAMGVEGAASRMRATWASMISAHLNRFKRYPPGAEGVIGRPVVRFTLDGSGRVTAVSLARSSGSALLDGEAMATVRRASPFPPPPDGRGASFNVPVNFTRR